MDWKLRSTAGLWVLCLTPTVAFGQAEPALADLLETLAVAVHQGRDVDVFQPAVAIAEDSPAPASIILEPTLDDLLERLTRETRDGGGPGIASNLLIGPLPDAATPENGYRLLIVMPGGNGGPGFHPFIKRIYKNALSDEYLLAQIVAPEWSPQQARQLVWPTKANPWRGMRFSTEQFVADVLDDIGQTYELDERYIFCLSWSSSGPAAYAISLEPGTRVTGSFVAMSVFKPTQLPPLANAQGRAYFILHSPDDFIPIRMAHEARDVLHENGARVELVTYAGGHGWRGDVYGNLRRGIHWLEQQRRVVQPASRPDE